MSKTESDHHGNPGSGRARWELTTRQLGILYHQRLHQESPMYNMGEYLEIRGHLDVRIFEAALRRVVTTVDAFHIRIHDDGESVWQYFDSPEDWSPQVIDFSAEADPRAAAREWMDADILRPFDIMEGPLFREALLKIAPGLFFWYQVAHHVAWDGASFFIVASRAAQAYAELLAGQEPLAEGSLGRL